MDHFLGSGGGSLWHPLWHCEQLPDRSHIGASTTYPAATIAAVVSYGLASPPVSLSPSVGTWWMNRPAIRPQNSAYSLV